MAVTTISTWQCPQGHEVESDFCPRDGASRPGEDSVPNAWQVPPSAWQLPEQRARTRRRGGILAVVVAAVIILCCAVGLVVWTVSGSRSTSGATGATSGTTNPGKQGSNQSGDLSSLAVQYNAIATRYQTAGDTWKSALSGPNFESASTSFAGVIEQSNEELQALPWPASLRADVSAFSADLGALQGDVTSLSAQSTLTLPQWVSTASRDASQARAASDRIILDLGQTPDNSSNQTISPTSAS